MKYFYSSFIIAIIGLVIAYFIGSYQALYICVLLSILEVSLSFDNAVVNAKILDTMDAKWRRRFIIYGIPIAVFGMRLVFPIVIVSIVAKMGLYETVHLAIFDPHLYKENLEANKEGIYTFGGGFLLMVFLEFFFSKEREVSWLKFLEDNPVTRWLKKLENISLIIALIVGVVLISLSQSHLIAVSYFSSILLYVVISSFMGALSKDGVRSGVIGFLYLEVLDASFSFDGVIGAFALSENIFIIMIGLGIGAMFVRSITIYLVEKKTLQSFIYLEHGAHYAILALSIIMFIKLTHEVSELITGLIGIAFILVSFISSLIYKKKHPQA
ncbi:DUF475 domain-containing protein [Helicobacter sp. 11S02629-2]|uniref:DUF475 domain-containing protein n=1 Tax=Helicobacter sp. 11S02629-2 TaxID=1476195 RepID=UPI000BA571F3|nr:DUF475 domain-containing protein [Helicobacter sp. 11S02629-2]PAF42885.1 hypothetical protein BKH40_07410 [Helicobacter sp. 11S02629-2]